MTQFTLFCCCVACLIIPIAYFICFKHEMGIQDTFLNSVRKRSNNHAKNEVNNTKQTLNINFANIFFKSYTVDDKDHPIYIFDSTYLPDMEVFSSDKQLYDSIIDKLIEKLIVRLPRNKKFSIIIFSSGFKKLNWKWTMGIKIYSKLLNAISNYRKENNDRLIIYKIYIVHESLWVRTLFQIWQQFKNGQILNDKELDPDAEDSFIIDDNEDGIYTSVVTSQIFETIYLNDLSELSQYVDITRLRISLNVYLYDLKINEYIELPSSYQKNLTTQSGIKMNKDFRQSMFEKIYERLSKESVDNKLVFYNKGDANSISIMIDIINRNNYCDISQWDIYSLASIFIWFLVNKNKVFFPLNIIKSSKEFMAIVSKDSKNENIRLGFQLTYKIFKNIMEYNCYFNLIKFVIPLFINMIKHYDHTHHNYETVSEVLVVPLCKLDVDDEHYRSNKKLGKIFINNVLNHFEEICYHYEEMQKNEEIQEQHVEVKKAPIERLEQNLEFRPVPHLTNRNVSKPVGMTIKTKRSFEGTTTPTKSVPKLPNPRKSSNVLSPVKAFENKKEGDNSPSKRQMGGALSKSHIDKTINLSLAYQSPVEHEILKKNEHISTDSELDDTKTNNASHGDSLDDYTDSRNNSETLHFLSDDSSVKSSLKKIAQEEEDNLYKQTKRNLLESPKKHLYNDESVLPAIENLVLSPIKIKKSLELKTSSRSLSVDANLINSGENKIINGHGNDEDIWEYVITKKENNKLIKDVNSFKNFEEEIKLKKSLKNNTDHQISSANSKSMKDRKVSNLIMMFEERSEGLKLLKDIDVDKK